MILFYHLGNYGLDIRYHDRGQYLSRAMLKALVPDQLRALEQADDPITGVEALQTLLDALRAFDHASG